MTDGSHAEWRRLLLRKRPCCPAVLLVPLRDQRLLYILLDLEYLDWRTHRHVLYLALDFKKIFYKYFLIHKGCMETFWLLPQTLSLTTDGGCCGFTTRGLRKDSVSNLFTYSSVKHKWVSIEWSVGNWCQHFSSFSLFKSHHIRDPNVILLQTYSASVI